MKCNMCGWELSENAVFCPKCGTKIDNRQDIPDSTEIPDEHTNGLKKKLPRTILIGLTIVIAVSGGVLGTFIAKTNSFNAYLKEYAKVKSEVNSLGLYADEYENNLQEATDLASNYKIWKYDQQKAKMDDLCTQIIESDKKFQGFWDTYNGVIAEIEDSKKYFLGDYESEYTSQKQEFQDDLQNYKEQECKKLATVFAKWKETIPEYNVSQLETADKELSKWVKNTSGYYSYETKTLKDTQNNFKDALQGENYLDAWNDYQEFVELKQTYDDIPLGSGELDSYYQMDAATDNVIKLYYSQFPNDMIWNENGFIIQEYTKKNGWQEADLLDIRQIEGNLSIDLVADISTSMDQEYGQFDTMKTAIDNFVNSTRDDTYLGLSVISNIYRREATFTQNKETISDKIWQLYPEGRTSLYQSLYSSVMYAASTSGAKCVVAFTDGKNEPYGTGYDYSAQDVIVAANMYKIPVYIIAIGSNVDSNVLSDIAYSTGGDYYDNIYVSELESVYNDIYSAQEKVWELSYKSKLKNTSKRTVYCYCPDNGDDWDIRSEFKLNPSDVVNGYSMAGIVNSENLASYYTNKKYLSAEEMANLNSIDDLQTLINIYCAKKGYKFSTDSVLKQMKSLGVIKKNGSKSMSQVMAAIKKDRVLYANFSMLYNTRYEWVYNVAAEVYEEYDGFIDLDELKDEVNTRLGQTQGRFNYDIAKAYKVLDD